MFKLGIRRFFLEAVGVQQTARRAVRQKVVLDDEGGGPAPQSDANASPHHHPSSERVHAHVILLSQPHQCLSARADCVVDVRIRRPKILGRSSPRTARLSARELKAQSARAARNVVSDCEYEKSESVWLQGFSKSKLERLEV